MTKELLTILTHQGDTQGVDTQEEYRDTVQVCSNGDQESQSIPAAESGKSWAGQQEGLLQVYQQQEEGQGKCRPAAEWEKGTGDKGHGKG